MRAPSRVLSLLVVVILLQGSAACIDSQRDSNDDAEAALALILLFGALGNCNLTTAPLVTPEQASAVHAGTLQLDREAARQCIELLRAASSAPESTAEKTALPLPADNPCRHLFPSSP